MNGRLVEHARPLSGGGSLNKSGPQGKGKLLSGSVVPCNNQTGCTVLSGAELGFYMKVGL